MSEKLFGFPVVPVASVELVGGPLCGERVSADVGTALLLVAGHWRANERRWPLYEYRVDWMMRRATFVRED